MLCVSWLADKADSCRTIGTEIFRTVFCVLVAVLIVALALDWARVCSGIGQLHKPVMPMTAPIQSAVGIVQSSRHRRRRRRSADAQQSEGNVAASYARFSSSNQREESNEDQQRKCREAAEQNGHNILSELEFSDQAVSGTKRKREGLDEMLRAAEAGEFQVLYVHCLSRLARESVITMQLLKKLVYVWKVRIVSVSESIDSNRDNWDVIASILSLMHERFVKQLGEDVFRGQEGAVLANLCVGDYRFGYSSVPIPGSEKTRKGRNAKPRTDYVIDQRTAPWVIRIFHWFVRERRSIRWITRELNRLGAPKDHRATTPHWHHNQVAGVLASEKYAGIWPWGEMQNVRDPETGKISQEPRAEEDCEQWTRRFEHLRIIDDHLFDEAQRLLEENYAKYAANRRDNGRLVGSARGGDHKAPRHLLSGLIKCSECGSTFHVGGTGGKYLFCPGYQKGACNCKTQLRRDRAERMILAVIGQRILDDPVWYQAVYEHTLDSWRRQNEKLPSELAAAERALADVERKIERLVDQVENGMEDPSVIERLEERRSERRELVKSVERQKRANENRGPEPTEAWVREQLGQLGECLHGSAPAAAYALRDLVIGSIEVTEIRREGRKRHYLQGRFVINANSVASAVTGHGRDDEVATTQGECEGLQDEFVIDFVDPNPLDEKSERAKQLYDQDLLNTEIAKELGCSRAMVTKLLKCWFGARGIPMPDSAQRRFRIERERQTPHKFTEIADEVKRQADDGYLLQEIAEQLGVNRDTVTKAFAWWHSSRGLPIPDGRTRRKSLERKVSRPPRHKDENGDEDAA